ncbi:MAG: ABC transporter permease, partial [Gemmatimonadota bacterium]
RFQVIALTVLEGLFLAAAGGVLGLALGQAALQMMVRYVTGQATIVPYWLDFSPGARSFAMAGLLTTLTLAVAALLPAIRASRASFDGALRRTAGGRAGGARAMAWVVGVEVALSCFLLAVSSVVVEEALNRLRTGTDFVTQGVVTGRFILEPPGYAGLEARRDFLGRLEEAVRADPAIQSLALASALPGKEGAVVPAGIVHLQVDGGDLPPAQVRSVDPSFLPLLGGSITTGRLISAADRAQAQPVAVVNEAFVGQEGIMNDAIGREIVIDRLMPGAPYTATVVGVVDDRGVTPGAMGRGQPGIYLPLDQVPPASTWLLVRTRDGTSLFDVWKRSVAPLDPHLPLGDVLTLEETLRRGHGAATLFMSIFLTLGGVTLFMALVGLHGVHAFTMAGRAKEIGVRRALGASSGQVLREGMRKGLGPVWLGLLVGLPPGVLVARSVMPVESSVRSWLLVPPLLLLTSLVAVWWPTWRTSLVEPTEVLREL